MLGDFPIGVNYQHAFSFSQSLRILSTPPSSISTMTNDLER